MEKSKQKLEQVARQGAKCLLTGNMAGWEARCAAAAGMGCDADRFVQLVAEAAFSEGYNFRGQEVAA